MASTVGACLLLWSLLLTIEINCITVTTSAAVGLELTPPCNLTMITLNTNFTLVWDWDQSHTENHTEIGAVTFTAQYIGKYKLDSKRNLNWPSACKEIPHKTCDFTASNMHYLGIYILRVQANANGRHSKWQYLEFCPDKEAALGPPSKVDLAPAGSGVDVLISDPLTSDNNSMRNHVSKLYYHIHYWELSADPPASRIQALNSSLNLLTLSSLKAWTWYCVSIQSRNNFYKKNSSFTAPQCIQTEGPTPWWQITLYFLGSLIIFLAVLLSLFFVFWCCKMAKSTLFPKSQLPTHLKEYLYNSTCSDIPRLLNLGSEAELLYDHLILCGEPAELEFQKRSLESLAAPPSGLNSDNSVRHSRQDSNSSGDSGLYSAGGTSNLQQPIDSQTSSGSDVCQTHFDLQQGKMQETTLALKTHQLITDEGIVDVLV